MFELRDNTAELHAGVGRFIVNNNIDILVTVGDLSKNIANAASEDKNIEIHCLKTIEEAIRGNYKSVNEAILAYENDEITRMCDSLLGLLCYFRGTYGDTTMEIVKQYFQ